MNSLRAYLHMRRRLLGRLLWELGWWRLLVLGVMLLAVVSKALATAAGSDYGHYAVPAALLFSTVSAHRQRADLDFLRLSAPAYRGWLAAEYALLALPVAVWLLLLGRPAAALLTVLLPPLATWLPAAAPRAVRHRRRSVFRSEAFEWVSGFRAVGGWLVWAGLLGLAAWQHRHPMLPALALAGWALCCTSFYGTPEPLPWLLLAARSPGAYLRRRGLLGAGYFLLLALPLAYCAAQSPAGGAGAAAVLAWGLLVLTLAGLAKYAFYPNALLMQLTQGGAVLLALLLFVNAPIYAPVLLAVLWALLLKSRRRLAAYRYD